jgi:hypothetical protein
MADLVVSNYNIGQGGLTNVEVNEEIWDIDVGGVSFGGQPWGYR